MRKVVMAAVLSLILSAMVSTSYGEYTAGYQWNFQSLFGSSSSDPGLSEADSEGNRAFEYRYSANDGTPDTSTLMGAYIDSSWQPTSEGGYEYQNIAQAALYAGDQAVQVHWIAPVDGNYQFTVTAYGLWENGDATQEIVWVNGTQVNKVDAYQSSYSYVSSTISLKAGQKIAFLFSGVNSTQASIGAFNMVVTLQEPSSPLSYTAGFQWNYQTLFNETNSEMAGYSLEDSAGYRAFQYRYANSIYATPDETSLMGTIHTWETAGDEGGWQRDSAATYAERIRKSSIVIDGASTAAVVEWVAPIEGYYNVYITATDISDNNWATQEKVWIAGELIDTAQYFGTDTGYGSNYGFYRSRVHLSAGDAVAFLFSGWNASYAMIGNFNMIVTLCPESYPDGYEWDYTSQFGTDNGNPGRSAPDALDNRPFQYRYSSFSVGPDNSALMTTYHSWSNLTWQQGADREYTTRLASNRLIVGGGDGVQVHWVAPQDGLYNVMISATGITDNGWATQEKVWVNGDLKSYANWLGADTGYGNAYSWSGKNIQLKKGDVIAFLFSGWGASYAESGTFIMKVTLVLPDTTDLINASGNIGTVNSMLNGVSQGGDSCSYLKSDIVSRMNALGIKLVRLEAVPGNNYYGFNDSLENIDWTNLDTEIENIKSTGAEIMLNVFYMAKWLSTDPTGDDWRFTLPSDMDKWQTLVKAIVTHVNITKGYNIKYWEFWNEPSGGTFFTSWNQLGGQYLFANFYAKTAEAIKSVDSTALVGGFGDNCASTSVYSTFFDYCIQLGAPIDFLTMHLYGQWLTDGLTNVAYFSTLPTGIDSLYYNKFGKHVPIFMTEWNADCSSQVTTDVQQPAYMARALYWMQNAGVDGACLFRVEPYSSIDRSVMKGNLHAKSAGRILQMWGMLPNQLCEMNIDSTTGIATIVARSRTKVAVMLNRYDAANTDPIDLTVVLAQYGFSGSCTLTKYVEDSNTVGNEDGVVSTSVVSLDVTSNPVEAYVTLNNYSTALIVLESEGGAPVLSVSPTSKNVDQNAGTTTFNVSNTGTGEMAWTALVTEGSDWLSITSGSSGANAGSITVEYDANTDYTATRTGTIRIIAEGAEGSPIDVTVTQAKSLIPGDANGDGLVDVGDLGILAAHYGATSGATWSTGDFNGDGAVDVGDLGILAAHYGTGSSSSIDFDADYAKVFGSTSTNDRSETETTDDTDSDSVCTSLGLPLIAGLVLMSLCLVKLDE